jgi:hypothetical protein
MAMGILSERYRSHAEELRAQFPGVYRPLAGDEWKRLMKLMEGRRPEESNVRIGTASSRVP